MTRTMKIVGLASVFGSTILFLSLGGRLLQHNQSAVLFGMLIICVGGLLTFAAGRVIDDLRK